MWLSDPGISLLFEIGNTSTLDSFKFLWRSSRTDWMPVEGASSVWMTLHDWLPFLHRFYAICTFTTGYLHLSDEEFFKPPAACNLRGHNFKIRQPRFHLAKRKVAFAVRSAGLWNRLPPHIAEAPTVPSFKDHLDANWCSIFTYIVWPYPVQCSYANGFGVQVLIFIPVNLIDWLDLTWASLVPMTSLLILVILYFLRFEVFKWDIEMDHCSFIWFHR